MRNDPNRAREPGVGSGNSKDNLQKWLPGQSGNPKGRPKKGQSLTERLYDYGQKIKPGKRITYNEEFIKMFWDDMLKKNEKALKMYYMDRIDGKPKESISVNKAGDENIITIDELPDELKREYLEEEIKKLNDKNENKNEPG